MLSYIIETFSYKLFFANQIVSLSNCSQNTTGFVIPCASKLSYYPYGTITVLRNFTFTVVAGYNKLMLSQSVQVYRGNLILLVQGTGRVALDQTGALYSDLQWSTSYGSKLKENSNWRFYLDTFTDFTSYQQTFDISYTYSNIGFYNFSLSFVNSTVFYQQFIYINESKLY